MSWKDTLDRWSDWLDEHAGLVAWILLVLVLGIYLWTSLTEFLR